LDQAHAGLQGAAQPSPTLGDARNAEHLYLEVRCLGCDTHPTVALDIVRRPETTPIHELERYMRCKDCSEVRGGYPYKGAAANQDFIERPAVALVAGRLVTLPSRGAATDFSVLARPVRDQAVGVASRAPSCLCRYYSLCE
jgi:hypothetical protein